MARRKILMLRSPRERASRPAFAEAKPLRLRAGRSTHHGGPTPVSTAPTCRRGIAKGESRPDTPAHERSQRSQPSPRGQRSEEQTSKLQSLLPISIAVLTLKKKKKKYTTT